MSDEQVIRIKEAFKRIAVGKTKGFALLRSGKLQSFLIGESRVTTNAMIRDYLEKSKLDKRTSKLAQNPYAKE